MLQPEDAKRVFQHYAQSQGLEDPVLVELQGKIVRRCAGLPLALRLIGAALAGTRKHQRWDVSNPQAVALPCASACLQASQVAVNIVDATSQDLSTHYSNISLT
jgi:hypothetical protein